MLKGKPKVISELRLDDKDVEQKIKEKEWPPEAKETKGWDLQFFYADSPVGQMVVTMQVQESSVLNCERVRNFMGRAVELAVTRMMEKAFATKDNATDVTLN